MTIDEILEKCVGTYAKQSNYGRNGRKTITQQYPDWNVVPDELKEELMAFVVSVGCIPEYERGDYVRHNTPEHSISRSRFWESVLCATLTGGLLVNKKVLNNYLNIGDEEVTVYITGKRPKGRNPAAITFTKKQELLLYSLLSNTFICDSLTTLGFETHKLMERLWSEDYEDTYNELIDEMKAHPTFNSVLDHRSKRT